MLNSSSFCGTFLSGTALTLGGPSSALPVRCPNATWHFGRLAPDPQPHFQKGEPARVSHIVTIQTQVRDAAAVAAACQRLSLPLPTERTVRLFSGSATGLAVELPGWHYPVVCDLASGNLKFDN